MSNVAMFPTPSQEEPQPAPQIYAAILAINAELPPIPKRKKGNGLNFDAFLTEEIIKIVRPVMLKHQVFVVSRGVERSTEYSESNGKALSRHYVFMNHVFYHADGSSIETSSFGEGEGFNSEGLAKAHTRSLGAALREIFLIVDESGNAAAEGQKKIAGDAFSQYWARTRELKLTNGKEILAQYGNDPVKALQEINRPAPKAAAAPSPVAPTPTLPVDANASLSEEEWRAAVAIEKAKLKPWLFKKIVLAILQVEKYEEGIEYQALERDRAPLLAKLREESSYLAPDGRPKFTSTTFWNLVAKLRVGKDFGSGLAKKWTVDKETDWEMATAELERSVAPVNK